MLEELSTALSKLSKDEIKVFLNELLTTSEINTLSKRWQILKMLSNNCTQRQVSKDLSVGLCKVTRGAKILKQANAVTTKIIKGE